MFVQVIQGPVSDAGARRAAPRPDIIGGEPWLHSPK